MKNIKYIILIIITIICTTGCFDYNEINNLVIITGIGLDYKDEEYKISIEALYQDKESNSEKNEYGVIKTSSGKTISEAFNNITLGLEKEPYYAHLKVLVISNEIASNHLNEVFDYFLRNNQIRNIFEVVISTENTPEEILDTKDKYFPSTSEKISNLLKNNNYSNYIAKNKYFKNIASNYISKDKNITLTGIKILDNNLTIDKLIIFNNKKPVGFLDKDKAITLSILDNKNPNSIYKYECDKNKYSTIKIYKSKSKISIKKNKYIVNLDLNAELIENGCNINLDKIKNEIKLNKKFKNIINDEINNLINYLKINNSDILGINKKYYNKYKKKNQNYFKDKNYEIKTNIKINKKGLIFEVNND